MNRTPYFNYIEEKLGTLAYRINLKGRLNILDLHIHSESFYAHLLNKLYGLSLVNLNPFKQNVEAVDLIDHTHKFIIQVSATNTKVKVESALAKDILKNYPGYTFKFISISNDAKELRKGTFLNPHATLFNPKFDIIDNKSILDSVLSSDIDKQKAIYELIQKELGTEVDIVKLDSNLALIINLLSQENLSSGDRMTINPFEIERKITHNKINITKSIIDQYVIYHTKLDKKYTEFDSSGSNKSISVLQKVHSCYIESCVKFKEKDADSIFLQVIEEIKDKVLESANFVEIPIDELELCVKIIVVDAFIRCKIFENPENYDYAITR